MFHGDRQAKLGALRQHNFQGDVAKRLRVSFRARLSINWPCSNLSCNS